MKLGKNLDPWLRDYKLPNNKLPMHFFFSNIEICVLKAHRMQVNKLVVINSMDGFASCSLDKTVQIFSLAGQHWGRINLAQFGKYYWTFPYNWLDDKRKELDYAYEIMDKLDNKKMIQNEKD